MTNENKGSKGSGRFAMMGTYDRLEYLRRLSQDHAYADLSAAPEARDWVSEIFEHIEFLHLMVTPSVEKLDPINTFFAECVERGRPGDDWPALPATEFYHAFENWCRANARFPIIKKNRFGRAASATFKQIHTARGKAYEQIRLQNVPVAPARNPGDEHDE